MLFSSDLNQTRAVPICLDILRLLNPNLLHRIRMKLPYEIKFSIRVFETVPFLFLYRHDARTTVDAVCKIRVPPQQQAFYGVDFVQIPQYGKDGDAADDVLVYIVFVCFEVQRFLEKPGVEIEVA